MISCNKRFVTAILVALIIVIAALLQFCRIYLLIIGYLPSTSWPLHNQIILVSVSLPGPNLTWLSRFIRYIAGTVNASGTRTRPWPTVCCRACGFGWPPRYATCPRVGGTSTGTTTRAAGGSATCSSPRLAYARPMPPFDAAGNLPA